MDQNEFDLDLDRDDLETTGDLDLDLDAQLDRDIDRAIGRLAAPSAGRRRTATLTNSPGCAPAVMAGIGERAALAPRSAMRRVAVAGWSSPASASWVRPSRTLRKVARRAVDNESSEPA
ncbi:MAG: hypothetical protein IPK00_10050 [Deltaproteobacteria bacterium]|nr:hypothetical protein [Deltaproteobacteria bacterium]